MRDMDNIFIKSLQAVQKVMINDKHCFELYPFIVADCENVINVKHVRSFSMVVDFHYTTLIIQMSRHFEFSFSGYVMRSTFSLLCHFYF